MFRDEIKITIMAIRLCRKPVEFPVSNNLSAYDNKRQSTPRQYIGRNISNFIRNRGDVDRSP